jgi:serine/threonine protein kinase
MRPSSSPSSSPSLSQYETLEELGKGTYGRVFKVRRKSDGLYCVRKQVPIGGLSDESREETLNETHVMRKCDHFNIIKYYDSFIEDNNLNIIMEYCSGGDLSKKIKAQNM